MITVVPALMVGGAGTRLWPLSRQTRPKQFQALLGQQTLFQSTAARVAGTEGDVEFALPIVISGEAHAALVRSQLGADAIGRLVLEPVGRNTAPCAVMAGDLAFQADPDALVLLLPSDHHVADPDAFRRAVALAAPAAAAGKLVTFGVIPTRPETGYGYILAGEERSPGLWTVARFVEKPDSETAAAYVADGRYFWNAGIFLARAEKLLAEMARFRPDILEASRAALARADIADGAVRLDRAAFEACPSESLDYAVMERTADAVVAPIDIGWSDVGGFDTLWETSRRDEHGNSAEGAILIDVTDTLVRTDGPLVAALGVSDLVIVVQDGAVLVAPRERAQDIKRLIAELRTRGRTDAL